MEQVSTRRENNPWDKSGRNKTRTKEHQQHDELLDKTAGLLIGRRPLNWLGTLRVLFQITRGAH